MRLLAVYVGQGVRCLLLAGHVLKEKKERTALCLMERETIHSWKQASQSQVHVDLDSARPRALTYGPGSLSDLPVIGGGVSVRISVVVCDGHVVQPVVLWGERTRVGHAVGLVGESV